MDLIMKKNEVFCAAVCAMALVLGGCGGGDDGGGSSSQTAGGSTGTPAPEPTPSPVEKTVASPFLGTWKHDSGNPGAPDNYCTDNWPVVPASQMSQRGVKPIDYEFTETTMSYTHNIYADLQCTQLLGSVTLTGNIQWGAASINGWTDAAKVTVNYVGSKVTGSIVVDESEAKAEFGEGSKTILGISNKKLYAGDMKTVGADGYPTAFKTKNLAYR